MKSVFLKQTKPTTTAILGAFIGLLTALVVYEGTSSLGQTILMFSISIILLAYSMSHEINEEFANFKHFKLFGNTVFKTRLPSFCPERIVILPVIVNTQSDRGPLAAIGKNHRNRQYAIRLFKDNKHSPVFRSNSLSEIKSKGAELGKVLNQEIVMNI